MECIFCKIIEGKLPSYKIYEDDLFIVILDKFPLNLGHCLVIPKFHVEDIFGLCEKECPAIMPLAQKIALKLKKELEPSGFNIQQNNGRSAGQVVFHYHLHIIPRYDDDGAKISFGKTISTDDDQLMELAEKLKM